MLKILTSDAREAQAEFYKIIKIKINKYINIY